MNSHESRAINCSPVLTDDSFPGETVDTTEPALAVVDTPAGDSGCAVANGHACRSPKPVITVGFTTLCDSKLLGRFKCISPEAVMFSTCSQEPASHIFINSQFLGDGGLC